MSALLPVYEREIVLVKGKGAKLFDKVKKGGSGVWGQIPMPPNPQVSDADVKTMIAYVLALKK